MHVFTMLYFSSTSHHFSVVVKCSCTKIQITNYVRSFFYILGGVLRSRDALHSSFYCAMPHRARYCHSKSSLRPSVRPSVFL